MTTNDQAPYTAQKQSYKPTTHKSDFSFSSPQEEAQTVLKRALMESSRIDVLRNRVQLFTEMKQNASIVSLINKSYPKQFVDQMRTQQRVQIEKLLLEISRLHDMLEDQEKMHRHAIQRLKQESEQIALLRISNLKQSQYSQIQMIQIQLRKTKQALQEKTVTLQELQRSTSRKIQNLRNENENLKADLKQLVERKNIEFYELKTKLNQQSEEQRRKQNETITQIKSLAEKQVKKIMLRMQQKERKINDISIDYETSVKQKARLEQMMQREKKQLEEKLERMVDHQRQHRQLMTRNMKEFYEKQLEQTQQNLKLEKEMFTTQIQQLVSVIKIKDQEVRRNFVFNSAQSIEYKMQISHLEEQNSYLQSLIQHLKNQHLQELQLLKVKMGVLHKSDLQALVRLYEAKIQSLAKDVEFSEKQTERVANQIKKQRERTYEMKKKYDYTISFLHQQISELRLGAGNHEKEIKQKLDNEKSMMMLTSRNFIKENEAKQNNIRFYEQQLRKLRQLLQIQAQEVEQSEKNVEQKIKLAEEQLSRLSNKIIEVKSEAEQSQKKLKQTIDQKNKEIKRLNTIMSSQKSTDKKDDNLVGELKKLDQQISKKQDELRTLKNRCQDLQSSVRTLKAQNQKLILQNQINSEDAKKKYKTISDKNLADMKAFYDRRLQQLQNDKKQLDRINSSQAQQITQLIKRYKDLQENMKQLLKQTKKRGDLEARIVSLGMDNNLVKNMSELFHR